MPTQGTWCIFGIDYPGARGGGYPWMVEILLTEAGWPQTGLSQFVMTFVQRGKYIPYHLASGEIILDGSLGDSDRWENYIASLPIRRLERKGKKLKLVLRGNPALDWCETVAAKDAEVSNLMIALEMVHQGLLYAQSKLKRADGIDLSPLIAAADALAQRRWESDDALRDDLMKASAIDKARMDAMDPWSKIDMRGFHAKAKEILDDPNDWSQSNDFSPHGNDLGADILGQWQKLKRKSVADVAAFFEIKFAENEPETSLAKIEISLALAFGHLKKTGSCPHDVATNALEIISAERECATDMIDPSRVQEWNVVCDRYISILGRQLSTEST